MFTSISKQMSKRKRKLLDDPGSWHHVFYNQIISQIDELPYSVLYSQSMGRPNSSVRRMIGMMILKEGQGWSDEQLFEECRFNLKVMSGLGLVNMDDDVPTESTYYEFRRLLGSYNASHGRDLIKETFSLITSKQIKELNIGGKKIRMDSKLINSNIAKSSRLALIVETVRKYVLGIEIADFKEKLETAQWAILKELQIKSTSNVTYSLNGHQKSERLLEMGLLIKFLLQQTNERISLNYKLLKRLYEEQYEEQYEECCIDQESEEGKDIGQGTGIGIGINKGIASKEVNKSNPQPKSGKDISSSSMQSVHDPQATYRCKGKGLDKQSVHGYHVNITESCDPADEVNLVTDVEVVSANICENEFLQSAIENSESVLQTANETQTNRIEEVITDAGYDSLKNRTLMLDDQNPKWSIAKTKGGKRIYQIDVDVDVESKVSVTHITSQQRCEVTYSKRADKYVIHNPDGTKRYMTEEQIENYIQRQNLEEKVDVESYNLRANAESTIHQCFHRLNKRSKIVYRGLQKCQWYVISRAFWVNLKRIVAQKVQKAQNLTFIRNISLRSFTIAYATLIVIFNYSELVPFQSRLNNG